MVAALVGCSSGSQNNPTGAGGTGQTSTGAGGAGGQSSAGSGNSGLGGAPSAATDTNPANPHVTNTPPSSPNGPPVTVQPGSGGLTGAGTGGSPGQGTGGAPAKATGGASGGATGGVTGAGGGVSGAGGAVVDAGAPADAGSSRDAAATGPNGGIPASWPTVDCVGGPCGPPGVCVNLDFLFVACAHCGGNDEVCCPPYSAADPWLGTCGAGMICAHNPNFHTDPPLDLVQDVCQVPGSPPPSDGGLNHERLRIAP